LQEDSPQLKLGGISKGSALVGDEVVVPRFGAARVFVDVGAIGGEADGVAGGEVVALAVDVEAAGAGEDDEDLVRAAGVGLGGVLRARRQAQLVELDERSGADGGEGAALQFPV